MIKKLQILIAIRGIQIVKNRNMKSEQFYRRNNYCNK